MALTLHGTVADNTAVLDRKSAKPLIINGDMQHAQRGTSLTGQTGTAYQMDRFGFQMGNFGTWTMTQADDGPAGSGFTHALKWDCTTADTDLGAGDFGICRTLFEGQDLQSLKKGTSSAEKLTLSFYVKTNKTGTYTMEFFDTDNQRQISKTYTVNSANTWEQKIINIPADTTGALDNDNASSLVVNWWLGAGSTYAGGTVNTSAWAGNTNANRVSGSNVNLADSTDNNWFLTGVQLEVGEFDANSIAPFQHESFGDSLTRCERYYKQFGGNSSHERICLVFMASTSQGRGQIPISMRAAPSIEANNLQIEGTAAVTVNSVAVDQPSTKVAAINFNCNTGIAAGQAAQVQGANNTSARLKLSAEL